MASFATSIPFSAPSKSPLSSIISVDAKKREPVAFFAHCGAVWMPAVSPEQLHVHVFVVNEDGNATTYGVYDV